MTIKYLVSISAFGDAYLLQVEIEKQTTNFIVLSKVNPIYNNMPIKTGKRIKVQGFEICDSLKVATCHLTNKLVDLKDDRYYQTKLNYINRQIEELTRIL